MTGVVDLQAALRDRVAEARDRVGVLQAEHARARRAGQRALDAVRAYHEDVEAGRRPEDPEEERALVAAATTASATTRVAPVLAHGKFIDIEITDEAVEGRLAGARQALEDAERELAEFEQRHVWDLVDAAAPAITTAHTRLLEALVAVDDALGDWSTEVSTITGLGRRTGRFDPAALAVEPVSRDVVLGLAEAVRRVRAGRPPAPPIPTRPNDEELDHAA